ncbi:mucin-17 [Drosophila obscura]|uniref:mucin-17 n=1 Tax=Drosophila obscura TaxID=7282 RepID=UPI001BB289D5|nr:mucin-17 [Drosophila obscura]
MTSNRIWLVLPLAIMLATLILAKSSVQAAPVEEVNKGPKQDQLSSTIEMDRQRIDCKLTLDAATMDSLGCHDEVVAAAAAAVPEASSTDNKPVQLQRHLKSSDSQPIYELQLVVWPSDIEDGDDFNPLEDSTTTTTTTTTTPTTTPTPISTTTTTKTTTITPPTTTTTTTTPIEQIWPLYEDQLVVFPQMDFEEENLDYFLDEAAPAAPAISATTARPWPIDPTGTTTPTPTYVVENYHVIHPNGTEEYKLVLSNGLANYKKLYTKRVGERQINVQEGYNSVPIAGRRNLIQTQYFIADERGYNVYRIEQNYHQPGLPKHLHYKATKASNM